MKNHTSNKPHNSEKDDVNFYLEENEDFDFFEEAEFDDDPAVALPGRAVGQDSIWFNTPLPPRDLPALEPFWKLKNAKDGNCRVIRFQQKLDDQE